MIVVLNQILPSWFVGWGPYAYFQVLEEIRSTSQANQQSTEDRVENQQNGPNINCLGITCASNLPAEDVESGRR